MLGVRTRVRRLRYGWDYGRLVIERGRFAANEARNRDRVGGYHLQDGGMPVFIRHHHSPDGTPSNDTWTLHELFADHCYEPPPVVDALLRQARPPRVVDLGANIGLFVAYVLARYPDARIRAFEPDPESSGLLRRALEAGQVSRCEVHQACAVTVDGPVRFLAGRHQFSHRARPQDESAEEVAGVDVFPYLRGADLTKIDIEGGEWALLADGRLGDGGPSSIVMEYHPFLCPEPDPAALARRLLEEQGYAILTCPMLSDEPILWAVKNDLAGAGAPSTPAGAP